MSKPFVKMVPFKSKIMLLSAACMCGGQMGISFHRVATLNIAIAVTIYLVVQCIYGLMVMSI